MKTPILYALEVLACSGVLLAAYSILLERRVKFGWCRLYLLFTTAAAALIPLLRIPVWPGEVIVTTPSVAVPLPADWTAEILPEAAAPALSPETICLIVYLLGAALVAGVMLWQIVRMRRLRRHATITRAEGYRLIRTRQEIASFSFLRTIYVWEQTPAAELEAILAHEASHIAHRHSAERILMELLKALMWWNPFAWIAARRLTEVEEFEADSDVLCSGYDRTRYMHTLFKQLFGYTPEIANGLRNSLTKKRFKMMTTQTKSRHNLLRLAGTLPALIGLLCAFSFTSRAAVIVAPEASEGEPDVWMHPVYLLNDKEVTMQQINDIDPYQIDSTYTLTGEQIPAIYRDRGADFAHYFYTQGKPRKGQKTAFEGQVLYPDGRPVTDAWVFATIHYATLPANRKDAERIGVKTDDQGRFRIKAPAKGMLTARNEFGIAGHSYDSREEDFRSPLKIEFPFPDSVKWESTVNADGKTVLLPRLKADYRPETFCNVLLTVQLSEAQGGVVSPAANALVAVPEMQPIHTSPQGKTLFAARPGSRFTVNYPGYATQEVRVPADREGYEVSVVLLPDKTAAAAGQDVKVYLSVYGKGEPLPGATVTLTGQKKGTVTDSKGEAHLVVPQGSVLTISYIGFESQVFQVGDSKEVRFVTSLKPTDQTVAKPGDKPLYLVNGVELDNLDKINPNQIKSLTVLKSGLEKYGEKGRNGVILVQLKGLGDIPPVTPARNGVSSVTINDGKISVSRDATGEGPVTTQATTEQGAIREIGNDEPFLIAETMPSFRGGDLNDFREWVQTNVKYPAIAVENKIQGRVVLSFIVEKDGSLSHITILQTPDTSLAEAAREVIAASSGWTPGRQGAQVVRVKYTLPVDFRLETTTPPAAEGASDKDQPLLIAETMPSFQGGNLNDFRQWVQSHVKYPAAAMQAKLEGRVVVSFIIEKDGTLTPGEVISSPGKPLSDEVMRLLNASPRWTPGMQHGKAVRVRFLLPIDFALASSDLSEKLGPDDPKSEGSIDRVVVVGYGNLEKP